MDLDGRAFVKRNGALWPADGAAREFLDELPDRKEVLVTVRRVRSAVHHRWFFSLLRHVVDQTDDFGSEEELLDAVKLATGHVERRMMLDGRMWLAPRSISFAAMGQDAFRRFVDRALFVLNRALGIDCEALVREVEADQKEAA